MKDCYEEKVLARSMLWMRRVDLDSPFPYEAHGQFKLSIKQLKLELDDQFFRLRKMKRDIRSKLHDDHLWSQLLQNVNEVRDYHKCLKESPLKNQLNILIGKSQWTLYSRVENVINLSSYALSKYQKQLLGYDLSFSMPHEKRHLMDYTEQMDKLKNSSDSAAYNFIFMNMDSIYHHLKKNYSEFFPRRFHNALNDLKRIKSIRISAADKGGKVVILDKDEYRSKMNSLFF